METVDELLTNNRKNVLFRKLLHKGFDDDVTKKIMCLWMFLKSKAFNEIYDKLYLASPKDFGYACVEAQMALKSLENDQISIDESPIPFPITSILIDPSISLVPIFRNREKVYHEILAFLDEVNNIKVDRKSTIVKKCIYNSGSTSISLAFTQQPSVCSKLNPFAKEWSPSRLEDRILFMTFSRGQPLSPSEIRNYFGRKYGDCVEDVFIYYPPYREPEFGKIRFKFSYIPSMILKDKEAAKIYIGGKALGLKKHNNSS